MYIYICFFTIQTFTCDTIQAIPEYRIFYCCTSFSCLLRGLLGSDKKAFCEATSRECWAQGCLLLLGREGGKGARTCFFFCQSFLGREFFSARREKPWRHTSLIVSVIVGCAFWHVPLCSCTPHPHLSARSSKSLAILGSMEDFHACCIDKQDVATWGYVQSTRVKSVPGDAMQGLADYTIFCDTIVAYVGVVLVK